MKEQEIQTMKDYSDIDGRSIYNAEQINYLEDQNYIIKKMNAGHLNASQTYTHRKKDFENASSYENLASSTRLVNTRSYGSWFKNFRHEK